MRRKSLTKSVKVALTFFCGLYPHVFIRKRALSANKAALNWLYPQIKPFVGGFIANKALHCKCATVGVVVEGFIIQGSRALILWAFLLSLRTNCE